MGRGVIMTDPNIEQIKSMLRWLLATVAPFMIAHGYTSSTTWELITGAIISVVPFVWGLITHTRSNAVVVVDMIAKDPESPVAGVVTKQTFEGKKLAESIPGNKTAVAGSVAASTIARS